MKNSINLVSKRRRPGKFHRRLFIVSVIFFSIAFLISAGLIGYSLILGGQLEVLKSDETKLIAAVNLDPEKKVKFLTVKERLSEIQKILNERKNLNNRINTVSAVLPQDLGISLIESDEQQIKLRVTAPDLVSLNNLIEEKIESYATEQNRGVKRIEMTSFGLNPNTLLYEATFSIEFI